MEQEQNNQLPDIQLALALKMAANPIFIIDRSGSTVWCNKAYCAMLGKSMSELISRPTPCMIPTRETANFFMDLWTVVMGGTTWIGELTERDINGKHIHVEAVFTPLTDANNRPALFLVLENDITTRKLNLESAWQLANHDRLTGLPNRGFFTSLLDRALVKSQRNTLKTGILFIDLDGFKAVNDTFGHDAGDMVLIEVARIMSSSVRKSDSVARFGGDEFACILEEIDSIDDATRIAQNIIDRIGAIELVGSFKVTVGASIGIAIYPQHGTTEAILRSAADAAMYEAKKSGKNCWSIAAYPKTDDVGHAS